MRSDKLCVESVRERVVALQRTGEGEHQVLAMPVEVWGRDVAVRYLLRGGVTDYARAA